MPDDGVVPLGHIRASHRVLGWCSLCPAHDALDELLAWRDDAYTDPADEANPPMAITTTYGDCRACGAEETVVTSVVTVRTRTGRRQATQWTYCLYCDDVPKEAADGQA
ncbi:MULTISPECIES: hypothetical protein [unclassified Streptomyces]|uniref:hypothetical protein n=1 Tax=unclassified Streptomyces TaxID=2593676 RepID=UPI00093D3214|nr:hypothetical protein [Streptomyces sp. TSRI0281]OKI35042.1 hypothetical protein A6A29_16605 [Streptomyces sp. TSRI0281]